jgi:hypothetical protein
MWSAATASCRFPCREDARRWKKQRRLAVAALHMPITRTTHVPEIFDRVRQRQVDGRTKGAAMPTSPEPRRTDFNLELAGRAALELPGLALLKRRAAPASETRIRGR